MGYAGCWLVGGESDIRWVSERTVAEEDRQASTCLATALSPPCLPFPTVSSLSPSFHSLHGIIALKKVRGEKFLL